jgi:hypothetical protein
MRHLDLRDRRLVAREMQDRARDVGEILHADLRQVFLEEPPAARDVDGRVLGAVHVLGVVRAADVADVVVQRADTPSWKSRSPISGPVAARSRIRLEQVAPSRSVTSSACWRSWYFRVALEIAGKGAQVEGHHVGRIRAVQRRRLVAAHYRSW